MSSRKFIQYPILLFILIYFSNRLNSQIDSLKRDSILEVANYHFDLAESLFVLGMDTSLTNIRIANRLYFEIGEWDQYVWTICVEASIYQEFGYVGEVWKKVDLAESEAIKYVEPNNMVHVVVYHNQAFKFKDLGDYKSAIKYFKKALDLSNKIEIPLKKIHILYLSIADLYRVIGDHELAIAYYKTMLNMAEDDLFGKVNKGKAYQGIGRIALRKERFSQAKEYISKANKLYETTGSYRYSYSSLYELAEISLQENDSIAFNEYKVEMQGIMDKRKDLGSSDFFILLSSFEKNFGSDEKCLIYLNQALDSLPLLGKKNRRNISSTVAFEKAKVYTDRKEFLLAIAEYKIALNSLLKVGETNIWEPNNYLDPVNALSISTNFFEFLLDNDLGKIDLNNQLQLDVFELFNSLLKIVRLQNVSPDSKFYWTSEYAPIFEKALEHYFEKNKISYVFKLFESNKSLSVLDVVSTKQGMSTSNIPLDKLNYEKKLKSRIAFLNRQLLEDAKSEKQELALEKEIKDLEAEYFFLTKSFEKEFPDFHHLFRPSIKTLEELKTSLRKDELYIAFYAGNSHLYRLIVSHKFEEVHRIVDSEMCSKLAQQSIQKIREGINQELSNELVKLVLGESDVDWNDYKKLTIIPDGFLLQFPFETLKLQGDRMLIEDYNLSYHYSANLREFLSFAEQEKPTYEFLGYAFSNNDGPLSQIRSTSDLELSSLLCAEKELDDIRKVLGSKNNLDIKTIKDFEEKSNSSKIIHLSTHALVDPSDYRLSRIMFEDDYITSEEIQSLSLNTELAVLSACETGIGKYSNGDGVMSLSKSFFLAGCKSVVMSLWPVDDCSTSDIMKRFYQNLRSGENKDVALRNAKLNYIKDAHPERKAPYYWAGFILVGNENSLYDSSFNQFWILSVFSLIFLIFFFKK